MAGIGSSPSGSSRPTGGRSRVKFFLFSTLVLFGLGFFAGISATKHAMTGPGWAQRLFGIEMPPPVEPAVVKPAAAPAPPVTAVPAAPTAPVPENHVAVSVPPPVPPSGAAASAADAQGFLGHWEVTDEIQPGEGAPTKITSGYVFNADGTGEFDTNGKKMYGLHWKTSPDFLTVVYDNEQAPQGDTGAVHLRWSVNADKTLLTLVPENGKDARASLYSVGPGVYHKK